MANLHILVVDDDAWILRMVTTVLEKRGYSVTTACDGEEAYEEAVKDPPDLLITDVMMPNMDGWTLVKSLRGRPEMAFMPVIFLTALSSDDDRIRGFRLGADDYLPKPFRFEELDLRVGRTMQRTQSLEQGAREQVKDTKGSAPSAISGDLAELGISSILVLMEMERKSGILTVSDGKGTDVQIALRAGQPVVAQVVGRPEPSNEQAVYFVLSWVSGSFSFEAKEITGDREIEASTTALLMEGARRIDEETRA